MKRILTISFLAVVAWSQAYGKHPKVARDLENRDPNATVDVIVQFKQMPTDAHHKKVADRGGKHKAHLEAIKAGLYSMRADRLAELADDPDVEQISPDRPVKAFLDYAQPTTNAAIALKYGYDGTGIGVAVIDSGVDTRADLKGKTSRIVYKQSFLSPNFFGNS